MVTPATRVSPTSLPPETRSLVYEQLFRDMRLTTPEGHRSAVNLSSSSTGIISVCRLLRTESLQVLFSTANVRFKDGFRFMARVRRPESSNIAQITASYASQIRNLELVVKLDEIFLDLPAYLPNMNRLVLNLTQHQEYYHFVQATLFRHGYISKLNAMEIVEKLYTMPRDEISKASTDMFVSVFRTKRKFNLLHQLAASRADVLATGTPLPCQVIMNFSSYDHFDWTMTLSARVCRCRAR